MPIHHFPRTIIRGSPVGRVKNAPFYLLVGVEKMSTLRVAGTRSTRMPETILNVIRVMIMSDPKIDRLIDRLIARKSTDNSFVQ